VNVPINIPAKSTVETVGSSKPKRRIKAAVASTSTGFTDSVEWTVTLAIMNVCMYNTAHTTSSYMFYFYLVMMNLVVGRTLLLRNARVPDSVLNAVQPQTDSTVRTTVLEREREELTSTPEKVPANGLSVIGTYARLKLKKFLDINGLKFCVFSYRQTFHSVLCVCVCVCVVFVVCWT
jgi:hypothetical protein